MTTKQKAAGPLRQRTSPGHAALRAWTTRAIAAIVTGSALGVAGGISAVDRLEPGRSDSVDSLAVMLDSISSGSIPGIDASRPGPSTPTADTGSSIVPATTGDSQLVIVPSVVDFQEGDARNAILDAGLQVGEVQFRPSGTPAGTVLGTFPMQGARVPLLSAVTLVLSDGRAPVDSLNVLPPG